MNRAQQVWNPSLTFRMAQGRPSQWQPLERPPRYEVKTEERRRPENVKEQVVKEREFESIHLQSKQEAEFDYCPTHCKKTCRMVVLRKNLTIEKGECRLFDDVRFFFYITNDRTMSMQEIIFFANDRCNQSLASSRAASMRAHALGRLGIELGLPGHRGAGLESKSMVWPGYPGPWSTPRDFANGIQTVPDQLHPNTVPDRAERSAPDLSYPES